MQPPPSVAQQVTIQMNPAYAGPGGSGGGGGGGGSGGGAGGAGAGGNGGVGFIPATYDIGDAPSSSSSSNIVYALPFEASNDGVYADADTLQSLV